MAFYVKPQSCIHHNQRKAWKPKLSHTKKGTQKSRIYSPQLWLPVSQWASSY